MQNRTYTVNVKRRGRVYYAYYMDQGARKVESLRTRDKDVAERKAEAIRRRINGPNETGDITLREYLPTYLNLRKLNNKGKGARSEAIITSHFERAVFPMLGDRPLATITEADVAAWIQSRIDAPVYRDGEPQQRACQTVTNEGTYLFALLRMAHKKGLIPDDPIGDLSLPEDEIADEWADVQKKRLSVDDLNALYANAKKYRHVWILAANTGLRRQELLNITKRDIDFAARELTVRSTPERPTKSGRSRMVPINDAAIRAIKVIGDWRRYQVVRDRGGDVANTKWHREPYLLKQVDKSTLSRAFKTDAARAKLTPRATLHWLRHTFCSAYVNAPGNLIQNAQAILGHSSLSVTQQYIHNRSQDLHAGVNNLSF